jgi:hypothetical protein
MGIGYWKYERGKKGKKEKRGKIKLFRTANS